MEFAAAALTSIGSAISTGAGAIGTALTGTAGALGAPAIPSLFGAAGIGGSTAATILAGGATVASVLNAQRAGDAKAFALNAQAEDADTAADLESIKGTDRRNSLKADLIQTLGARDVATAASGVDLSFGTPVTARNQALTDGERALATDSATEQFRQAQLRERAANLRIQAKQASAGGLGTAAALTLEGGAKLLKRG